MKNKWQCRWAPSLGELEETHQKVWGTKEYRNDKDPTVFFGIYGLKDLAVLSNHKGIKAILWAGSDIRHFINGYWIDEKGGFKLIPEVIAKWINTNCENWVENKVEYEALKKVGIKSKICPSFLGEVKKYNINYQWNKIPKVYTSVSGDDFELYRWPEAIELSEKYSDIEFHFYGNSEPFRYMSEKGIAYTSDMSMNNTFFHGKVSKEKMNSEIKTMQGSLRLLPLEGFSEIVAKSLLWGQWPVSVIPYPYTLSLKAIGELSKKKKPNFKGREWMIFKVNKYPWNQK